MEQKFDIKKITFSVRHLKNFTKIYASNWDSVPRCFKPHNYQGKGIEGKIEQFVSDLLDQELKRQTLIDLLWEHHHQGEDADTEGIVDSICELLEYPLE